MKLYSQDKDYKLYQGNMLDLLKVIEPNTIDSIVTDPPYELGFMNKGWDSSGIAFQKETWVKCYDVLKAGGYLLAFGGSRTFHRIACAIEDAGFEIRDTIMWLYGSGFPKSMGLDKALESKLTTGNANKTEFHKLNGIQEDKHHYGFTTANKEQGIRPKDYTTEGASNQYLKKLEATTDFAKNYQGWGTQLKPAYEPIIVARKPFKGSLVDNVIKWGVGGINIDECRISLEDNYKAPVRSKESQDYVNSKKGSTQCDFGGKGENAGANEMGRFPANVILTYDKFAEQEVCGGMPNTKNQGKPFVKDDYSTEGNLFSRGDFIPYNDDGSAARYYYCAKATTKDRDEGLEDFEDVKVNDGREKEIDNAYQKGGTLRKNIHPTVKPTELMQYLIRLVTPKGGTILDPFNGSGSTGKAAMWENKEREANYKYIGIELTEEYLPIAKARIEYVKRADNVYYETTDFEENKEKKVVKRQLTIEEFL